MVDVFELEKLMLPDYENDASIPAHVKTEALKAHNEGIPTGVGHHPDTGWFIIHAGQGPYIAWTERGPSGASLT